MSNKESNILKIENVIRKDSDQGVVKSVSFRFERNCVRVLEPNGAGKSTLLKMIAGIDRRRKSFFVCYSKNPLKTKMEF